MRITDSLLLARTKLKTKRLWHFFTILGCGLLFSVAVFASILITGLQTGINSYSKMGYGGRYFVQAYPVSTQSDYEKTTKKAEEISKLRFKKYKDSLRDPEDKALISSLTPQPQQKDTVLASAELFPPLTKDQIRIKTANLPVSNIYESRSSSSYAASTLIIVKDGKEQTKIGENNESNINESSVEKPILGAMSKDLLEPYVMPGQSLNDLSGGRIPVMVPMGYAAKLANKTIPKGMNLADTNNMKSKIRKELAGKDLDVCFRNDSALSLYNKALAQADEIKMNAGNKSYVKPDIIYAIPSAPCQPVLVVSDKRSAQEKRLEVINNQANGIDAPVTELVHFRIAGFVASRNQKDYLQFSSFLTSGPTDMLYTPVEYLGKSKMLNYFYNVTASQYSSLIYLQSSNMADYKKILSAGCPTDVSTKVDPLEVCRKNGVWFIATNFGNPGIVLQEALQKTGRLILLGLLAIVAIASFMMMITLGKIMADSRRETGIFRAIGAKRLDISSIYLIYGMILAARSYIIAFIIPLGVALYLNSLYSDIITATAVDAFGAYDRVYHISLVGFNLVQLVLIFAIIQVAALLACIGPIIHNVGRSPIDALRDEG